MSADTLHRIAAAIEALAEPGEQARMDRQVLMLETFRLRGERNRARGALFVARARLRRTEAERDAAVTRADRAEAIVAHAEGIFKQRWEKTT